MKFKEKDKNYPTVGDSKIVKLFALLPIKIGKETRWLEFVKINKIYKFHDHGIEDSYYKWDNINFVD